jgi:hypothetical protein
MTHLPLPREPEWDPELGLLMLQTGFWVLFMYAFAGKKSRG